MARTLAVAARSDDDNADAAADEEAADELSRPVDDAGRRVVEAFDVNDDDKEDASAILAADAELDSVCSLRCGGGDMD